MADEEDAMMEEEEETPEEKKDSDADPSLDPDYFPMGDIDVKEFGSLLAEAMVAGMQPVLDELITVKESFVSIKEAIDASGSVSTKEVAATKDVQAKQAETIASLQKQLASISAQLKELGAPPRSLAGLGATQDDSTVVKEGDPLLTSVPSQDPLSDFASFAIGAPVIPGA